MMAAMMLAMGGLVAVGSGAQSIAQDLAQADLAQVEGRWIVVIELGSGRCRWRGSVSLRQDGRRVFGEGSARPHGRRSRRCPSLGGGIEGRVTGPRIGFGFATGHLGRADFEGTYDPKTETMRGHWRAGRAAGAWSAERAR
jgi:hypothetical protein